MEGNNFIPHACLSMTKYYQENLNGPNEAMKVLAFTETTETRIHADVASPEVPYLRAPYTDQRVRQGLLGLSPENTGPG